MTFLQKMIVVAAAVGVYLIAHYFSDLAAELGGIAGVLLGWLIKRPGDSPAGGAS